MEEILLEPFILICYVIIARLEPFIHTPLNLRAPWLPQVNLIDSCPPHGFLALSYVFPIQIASSYLLQGLRRDIQMRFRRKELLPQYCSTDRHL